MYRAETKKMRFGFTFFDEFYANFTVCEMCTKKMRITA